MGVGVKKDGQPPKGEDNRRGAGKSHMPDETTTFGGRVYLSTDEPAQVRFFFSLFAEAPPLASSEGRHYHEFLQKVTVQDTVQSGVYCPSILVTFWSPGVPKSRLASQEMGIGTGCGFVGIVLAPPICSAESVQASALPGTRT